MINRPTIVLASTSRYRRELLDRLGFPFTVAAPNVDETPVPGEPPADTAVRLAEAKARSVASRLSSGLVIGSDQVADVDGHAVSKPGDHASAVRQLESLSTRSIVFHTGVAIVNARTGRIQSERVDVTSRFRRLSSAEIEQYLRRERPYDCAGGVRSEALGIALFESIESSDPTALIGLPLIAVVRMLAVEGFDVLAND